MSSALFNARIADLFGQRTHILTMLLRICTVRDTVTILFLQSLTLVREIRESGFDKSIL